MKGNPPSERAPTFVSRWAYYLSSIPTLLAGVRNWPAACAVFLGVPVRRPLTLTLRTGCRFRVYTPMEIWIVKETCLDRFYERQGFAIQDGWIVMDIGAAFGDFAVSVARGRPRTKIFAFEPLPEFFARLQEHIRLNATPNVHPFAEAIAEESGTLLLHTETGLPGQHRTGQGGRRPDADALSVPAITLDAAFARLGLERCDLLKLDCEGAEFGILFGASRETLGKVGKIVLEYHDGFTPRSHQHLVRLLEDNGFQVDTVPNPVHRELGLLYASRDALTETRPAP